MSGSKWLCVGLILFGVVLYGVAARREQLAINELTVTKLTLGSTEVTATAAELNALDAALTETVLLSGITHLIVVNGVIRDTSPTSL